MAIQSKYFMPFRKEVLQFLQLCLQLGLFCLEGRELAIIINDKHKQENNNLPQAQNILFTTVLFQAFFYIIAIRHHYFTEHTENKNHENPVHAHTEPLVHDVEPNEPQLNQNTVYTQLDNSICFPGSMRAEIKNAILLELSKHIVEQNINLSALTTQDAFYDSNGKTDLNKLITTKQLETSSTKTELACQQKAAIYNIIPEQDDNNDLECNALDTTIDYMAVRQRLIDIEYKLLFHDAIQITSELGIAAFCWQGGFILALWAFGQPYEAGIRIVHQQEPLTWLLTGLFSALGLIIGIMTSRLSLALCDASISAQRYIRLSAQLFIPVLLADSTWLPIVDISITIAKFCRHQLNMPNLLVTLISQPITVWLGFLLISWAFQQSHNHLFNRLNPGGEHIKITYQRDFVGVLTIAYVSLKFIPELVYYLLGLLGQDIAQAIADSIIGDCLLAGIGTVVLLPVLLYGQNENKLAKFAATLPIPNDQQSNQANTASISKRSYIGFFSEIYDQVVDKTLDIMFHGIIPKNFK